MNPDMIDLRDRIADADPAGDALPYTPTRCEAFVTDIVTGTDAERHRRTTRTGPRWRRSGPPSYTGTVRRRLSTTLVAASIVAVIAGLIAVNGQERRGGGSSEAARTVLVTAATNASDPPARASQYWEITNSSPRVTRISYYAVDGNRPSYFFDNYPADRDPRQPQHEIWTTNLTANQENAGWGGPNPVYLAGLPRDPRALRELLYQDTAGRGNSVNGVAFSYVADLLHSGIVPADLRRSLFQVLQTIPGIDITAANVTVHGRTGTVLSYREPGPFGLHEILLDVDTGMMMAERSFGMTDWTVITRKLVNDIPAEVKAAARHDTCFTYQLQTAQAIGCTQPAPPPT